MTWVRSMVGHESSRCDAWVRDMERLTWAAKSGRILAPGYLLTRTFCKITKDNKFVIVASTAFIRCQH